MNHPYQHLHHSQDPNHHLQYVYHQHHPDSLHQHHNSHHQQHREQHHHDQHQHHQYHQTQDSSLVYVQHEVYDMTQSDEEDGTSMNPQTGVVIYYLSKVFEETAYGLKDVFSQLHIRCEVTTQITYKDPRLHIVIGANFAPELPPKYIVYQMEQLTSGWMTPEYMNILQSAISIWDFSRTNVAVWIQNNLKAFYVPLYVPFKIIQESQKQFLAQEPIDSDGDIDVLFYGARNARRDELLRRLTAALGAGRRVVFRMDYDLFGAERDQLIEKAKVVLNVHFYEAAALEVHRVNYLLAKRKFVVSEPSADPALDALYRASGAVAFAPFDALPEACLRALQANKEYRRTRERAGLNLIVTQHGDTRPVEDAYTHSLTRLSALQKKDSAKFEWPDTWPPVLSQDPDRQPWTARQPPEQRHAGGGAGGLEEEEEEEEASTPPATQTQTYEPDPAAALQQQQQKVEESSRDGTQLPQRTPEVQHQIPGEPSTSAESAGQIQHQEQRHSTALHSGPSLGDGKEGQGGAPEEEDLVGPDPIPLSSSHEEEVAAAAASRKRKGSAEERSGVEDRDAGSLPSQAGKGPAEEPGGDMLYGV